MAELYAKICPKAVEKEGALKEREVAVLETIHNGMIRSVQRVNPSFKALNDSAKELEKKRSAFEKKAVNLKIGKRPQEDVDKAEADLAGVDSELEAIHIQEYQELARQTEEYLKCGSSKNYRMKKKNLVHVHFTQF